MLEAVMVAVGGVLLLSLYFIARSRRNAQAMARWAGLCLISLVTIIVLAIVDAGLDER